MLSVQIVTAGSDAPGIFSERSTLIDLQTATAKNRLVRTEKFFDNKSCHKNKRTFAASPRGGVLGSFMKGCFSETKLSFCTTFCLSEHSAAGTKNFGKLKTKMNFKRLLS